MRTYIAEIILKLMSEFLTNSWTIEVLGGTISGLLVIFIGQYIKKNHASCIFGNDSQIPDEKNRICLYYEQLLPSRNIEDRKKQKSSRSTM